MISTNLITFELSFQNSTETIIFNNTQKSLNDVVDFLKGRKYYIAKVKEFNRPKSASFKCAFRSFNFDYRSQHRIKFNTNK